MRSPLDTVLSALRAYEAKDRAAIEALIADDYRFTSPLDNGLDREAYLQICWPGSATMSGVEVIHGTQAGNVAFVVYEANIAGKRVRNCEVHTVRGGRLVRTEVYFGWDVPHPVPPGEHRE